MIEVYFRENLAATLSAEGERLKVSGPKTAAVKNLAEFYGRQSHLHGEKLLRYMLTRLRGNWWAKESDHA